jgi:hypothetical protein
MTDRELRDAAETRDTSVGKGVSHSGLAFDPEGGPAPFRHVVGAWHPDVLVAVTGAALAEPMADELLG